MAKRATSADVAQRAHVSRATVSYVLNDVPHKSISDETRERVRRAAAELGYVPNSAARRMKTSRANRIAVRLATALTSPRYYETLQGIRFEIEARGCSILLCNDRVPGSFNNYLDACIAGEADGIIYIASDNEGMPEAAVHEVLAHDVPLVAVDCMADVAEVSSVTYDYAATSTLRVEKAAEQGITRFAYIRPAYDNVKERERERGFHDAVAAAGARGRVITYEGADRNLSDEDGRDAGQTSRTVLLEAQAWVNAAPRDECFLCSSPVFQRVMSGLLRDQHLLDGAGETVPWQLRTVDYRFDHFEVGAVAARMLCDAMAGASAACKRVVQPQLAPIDMACL